ncbi:hypothetical protein FACS1894188_03530 [Clostridia bacterium]|nr:hypothetical protein FACS1894188_03530 [Clostridia bacterium]
MGKSGKMTISVKLPTRLLRVSEVAGANGAKKYILVHRRTGVCTRYGVFESTTLADVKKHLAEIYDGEITMSRMIIDIVVTLKAHMAQQEREKTVSRINQGLAVAKEKGVKLGRPQNESLPPEFVKQYQRFLNGEYGNITNTGFAKMIGIGRSTLYKYIKLYTKTIN